MNPGDVERVVITSFGYWRAEIVHSNLGTELGEVVGRGAGDLWRDLTAAGFGGFDATVRLRVTHGDEPQIVAYATGADATAHRGQDVDEPDTIATFMRWYVGAVLPRRTPGMRPNWNRASHGG